MHTRGHLKETIFLCGIFLLFSSKTAGQTCRGQCGDVLEKCSCHATCVSLLKCCADYNQSCFQVTPHSSSMLGGRALRILVWPFILVGDFSAGSRVKLNEKDLLMMKATATVSLLYCTRQVGYHLLSQSTGYILTDLESSCQSTPVRLTLPLKSSW
ncbi:hypothetical protein OYC64_002318 [Pagothenia borchgrevinki]|uniref:SMB domain-containing protein n=1 Tax=Pagothenia borchgrevinki TaxID=8213 RepID=A0ABD2H821_PAGBO